MSPVTNSIDNILSLVEKEGSNDDVKDMIQSLLVTHYDINTQNSNGNTLLMTLAKTTQEDNIKTLLAVQADIKMLNNENESALHIACRHQPYSRNISTLLFHEYCKEFLSLEEAAQALIDDGFEIYHAPYSGSTEILNYMLKKCLPTNSKHPKTMQTALHVCVIFKDMACIKLLLECKDLDLNALDFQEASPLHYIYQDSVVSRQHDCEQLELLKIFMNLGSVPTLCTSSEFFQISRILVIGNHEAIRVVLQSSIDYADKDINSGKTVLHYLSANRNPRIVDELKNHVHKFDVNICDRFFSSPLHIAVDRNNLNMIKFLLNHQANPNLYNQYGHTPLYYAYLYFDVNFEDEFDKYVELLLQFNANPQIIVTEKNDQVTIFEAARKGKSLHKLGPVIAHLAIIEGFGMSISEMIYKKMNSYPPLTQYFDDCLQLLQEEISGSVTLLKFITSSIKQLVKYCRNQELIVKLSSDDYNQRLESTCVYYYRTMNKWLSLVIKRKNFLDGVADEVYKIFKGRIGKSNLVIDKIIDYLDEDSLMQMYQLSSNIGVLHKFVDLSVTEEPDRQYKAKRPIKT